jgi:hypothetical protein
MTSVNAEMFHRERDPVVDQEQLETAYYDGVRACFPKRGSTAGTAGMSDAARALAALRRRHRKACAVCGKGFKAIATARYCSNACKQRAKYQRNKERV